MSPTAATPPRKLQDGEVRRYIARVHDLEGNHPLHGGDWFRVITRDNPEGEFGTRAWAEEVLERAVANYGHGKLAGHTDDVIVKVEPTLDEIKVDLWLTGNVVPIRDVPKDIRAQYRDTLARLALAAYRYGHPIHVNSTYRSLAEQKRLHDLWLAGLGPLASAPGKSPHGKGIGLDVPNVRNTPALIRECRKLDLIDDVPSEIWHLTNHHRVA